jgi:hypothetical protein
MDQSKKTMRHFYCRDVLWDTFEQMANDFDCSIDYLINEAMRYYARSKNYHAAQGTGDSRPGNMTSPPPMSGQKEGAASSPAPALSQPGARRTGAPPPPPAGLRPGPNPTAPPPMQTGQTTGPLPSGPTSGVRRSQPPAPRATEGAQAAPTLFLVFNNERIAIDRDQFIIGRGSKTSDLPIKDGNISRKHAAVIRRNGTYYIKDLGSTNGIDYKGMRIDNKRIDEGDIFHICDYELRFTYRT